MKTFISLVKIELSNLFSGYFALVMSTGIISLGAWFMNFLMISKLFLWLNIGFYVILVFLYVLRLLYFPKVVFNDLSNHLKSAGFLTLVAATSVLGCQLIVIEQNFQLGKILYILALVFWLVLIYFFFISITIRDKKPNLESGINGVWLLMVVSTQAISVHGSLLREHSIFPKEVGMFVSLCFFLLGCIFYIIIITLIFYRLTFFRLSIKELAPPYWINMGAVAITTLAGSILLLSDQYWGFVKMISPFLVGFTIMFWVIGTWWVPIIVMLGIWRHLYKKDPIKYNSQYWGLVFPLGMYSVCTLKMDEAMGFHFLIGISKAFLYLAVLAWILSFYGMTSRLFRVYFLGERRGIS